MRRAAALLGAVLVWLALSGSARADGYLGVYGGYAGVQQTTVDFDHFTLPEKADFEPGGLVGGKLGGWLKCFPFLALELNVWQTWSAVEMTSDVTLLNFSGSLLLQLPLDNVRLYGGGGVVGTRAKSEQFDSTTDWAVGGMAQAGVGIRLIGGLGVFAEYRYSWTPVKFDLDGSAFKMDLARNEALAGVSLQF